MPAEEPVRRDYYADLGVDQSASSAQITSAYRKLALQCHPDKVRDEAKAEAAEKFKKIGAAKDILLDAQKRTEYDQEYFSVQLEWERYNFRLAEYERAEQIRQREEQQRQQHEEQQHQQAEQRRQQAERKRQEEREHRERIQQAQDDQRRREEARQEESARRQREEEAQRGEARRRRQNEARREDEIRHQEELRRQAEERLRNGRSRAGDEQRRNEKRFTTADGSSHHMSEKPRDSRKRKADWDAVEDDERMQHHQDHGRVRTEQTVDDWARRHSELMKKAQEARSINTNLRLEDRRRSHQTAKSELMELEARIHAEHVQDLPRNSALRIQRFNCSCDGCQRRRCRKRDEEGFMRLWVQQDPADYAKAVLREWDEDGGWHEKTQLRRVRCP